MSLVLGIHARVSSMPKLTQFNYFWWAEMKINMPSDPFVCHGLVWLTGYFQYSASLMLGLILLKFLSFTENLTVTAVP